MYITIHIGILYIVYTVSTFILISKWHSHHTWALTCLKSLDCLFNSLLMVPNKKTPRKKKKKKTISNHALLALCEGNRLLTGGFTSQRASDAENISLVWCHQEWSQECFCLSKRFLSIDTLRTFTTIVLNKKMYFVSKGRFLSQQNRWKKTANPYCARHAHLVPYIRRK